MVLTNKTILITGASSGIGRAVAVALARRGNNLIVTARRQALLESLQQEVESAGSQCLAIACDALDETASSTVVRRGMERFGRIDCALLNIGHGPPMNMAKVSVSDVRDNMRLNYDTMVNYLVPLVEVMKRQGGGVIAHTNSLAGFLGLPMQGPYCAAKAAGRILFDACRLELKAHNIRFCALHAGFVHTEAVVNDGIPAPFEISAEQAAGHIIRGIEKEKRDYLFPFALRWLTRVGRILPKPLTGFLLSKAVPDDY
jgi:NAD(P)-dependent dehydrogenase (short-subunit alcohol dehydrogenase family)